MKSILVFGAGKSATVLIDYLLNEAETNGWLITVCDSNYDLAKIKVGDKKNGKAITLDVNNEIALNDEVSQCDLVISLLPPTLHLKIANACIAHKKHLLTASYIDEDLQQLSGKIQEAGVLFLCEMGLDPGIDHMSAMKLIDRIHSKRGKIISFMSHCGGLIAPESDDNPWHYKISWNPRNIVMAGKAGASFKQDGKIERVPYELLFDPQRVIEMDELGWLSYYPNRDSVSYMKLYGLETSDTFIRTTLRYPEFVFGWKNLIDLKLTDEHQGFESNGVSIRRFFAEHLARFNATSLLAEKISGKLTETKKLLEDLQTLTEAEIEAEQVADVTNPDQDISNFMVVDPTGDIRKIEINDVKKRASLAVMTRLHETRLMMEQLNFLELDSEEEINLGYCTAVDVLQKVLENKLALSANDRDMIVMIHQLEYVTAAGEKEKIESSLIVKGNDNVHTAMAKTVGLPLGIAAKLILQGEINMTGLQLPINPGIYEPVLRELEKFGIVFKEKVIEVSR